MEPASRARRTARHICGVLALVLVPWLRANPSRAAAASCSRKPTRHLTSPFFLMVEQDKPRTLNPCSSAMSAEPDPDLVDHPSREHRALFPVRRTRQPAATPLPAGATACTLNLQLALRRAAMSTWRRCARKRSARSTSCPRACHCQTSPAPSRHGRPGRLKPALQVSATIPGGSGLMVQALPAAPC
jgi:hypothetical protein